MEDRNSVIVLNPAITNNNNENEGLKRNHDVDVDDCPSPRKKANKKVSKTKEAVKNVNKKETSKANVSKKKAIVKNDKKKKDILQGFPKKDLIHLKKNFHKKDLRIHKNEVHKNKVHKNNVHKKESLNAKIVIHKKDPPEEASESSSDVTFDGIELDAVNLQENEESSIKTTKTRKVLSKKERKEKKQNENEERRKQYEVALEDYRSNPGMSFYGCAKKHKVNKTSLINYFKFGESFKGRGKGLTVLNKEEEKKICDHIIHLVKLGYSLTFFELRKLIQEALIKLCQANPERTSPWKEVNHFPVDSFVYNFAARNNLVLRSTMELSKARSMLSLEGLMSWYQDTANALVNHQDYADCWGDPRRVLNQDECGIQIGASKVKVLALKGATDVLYSKGGGSHEHVSLSVTANAAGECVGARVIYKGNFCFCISPRFTCFDFLIFLRKEEYGSNQQGSEEAGKWRTHR